MWFKLQRQEQLHANTTYKKKLTLEVTETRGPELSREGFPKRYTPHPPPTGLQMSFHTRRSMAAAEAIAAAKTSVIQSVAAKCHCRCRTRKLIRPPRHPPPPFPPYTYFRMQSYVSLFFRRNYPPHTTAPAHHPKCVKKVGPVRGTGLAMPEAIIFTRAIAFFQTRGGFQETCQT